MRNSSRSHGYGNQMFGSITGSFAYRTRYVRGLSQAHPHSAFFVPDHHQSRKTHSISPLGFFANPVYLNHFFLKFFFRLIGKSIVVLHRHIKISCPLLGPPRLKTLPGRGTCNLPGQTQFWTPLFSELFERSFCPP